MSGIESITLSTPRSSATLTGEAANRFWSGEGAALAAGGDPAAHVRAPRDGEFGDDDFLRSTQLDEVGEALRDLLRVAVGPTIVYRWKRKGGEKGGKAVYGQCQKLTGPAKHFGVADYLIWVAADHVRQAEFDARHLEALVYHELLHVETDEDKDGNPVYRVRGHDAELFLAEYERYGPWRFDLERVEAAMRQLPLVAAAD